MKYLARGFACELRTHRDQFPYRSPQKDFYAATCRLTKRARFASTDTILAAYRVNLLASSISLPTQPPPPARGSGHEGGRQSRWDSFVSRKKERGGVGKEGGGMGRAL